MKRFYSCDKAPFEWNLSDICLICPVCRKSFVKRHELVACLSCAYTYYIPSIKYIVLKNSNKEAYIDRLNRIQFYINGLLESKAKIDKEYLASLSLSQILNLCQSLLEQGLEFNHPKIKFLSL